MNLTPNLTVPTMISGLATVEVIEHNPHPSYKKIEKVEGFFSNLYWVEHTVTSFCPSKRGGAVYDVQGMGGSSWSPDSNIRNFKRIR